jgi:hypothetical protein
MRFHFRHRYDEIGCEDSARQPQFAKAGIVGLELGFDEVVAIQVDKLDFAMPQLIGETSLVDKEICVSLMAGTFGDGPLWI